MPHRGRTNLLLNLLNYPPVALFHKIKGNKEFPDDFSGTGDVLSHIGHSVDLSFEGKTTHVSLIHNPSHLEVYTYDLIN